MQSSLSNGPYEIKTKSGEWTPLRVPVEFLGLRSTEIDEGRAGSILRRDGNDIVTFYLNTCVCTIVVTKREIFLAHFLRYPDIRDSEPPLNVLEQDGINKAIIFTSPNSNEELVEEILKKLEHGVTEIELLRQHVDLDTRKGRNDLSFGARIGVRSDLSLYEPTLP